MTPAFSGMDELFGWCTSHLGSRGFWLQPSGSKACHTVCNVGNPFERRSEMFDCPKIGVFPPKWMVKIMENPIKHGMIWGENPLFLETSRCLLVQTYSLTKMTYLRIPFCSFCSEMAATIEQTRPLIGWIGQTESICCLIDKVRVTFVIKQMCFHLDMTFPLLKILKSLRTKWHFVRCRMAM